MSTPHRLIKILGIQRSGTNYLRQLLKKNLPPGVLVLGPSALGNKHDTYSIEEMLEWLQRHRRGYLHDHFDKVRIVVTVRSPMSWTIGHLRHIAQNLVLKRRSVFKAGAPKDHAVLIQSSLNPRYQSWRKLCENYPDRVVFQRFEDLLADPKAALTRLAERFGIADLFKPEHVLEIEKEVCSNGKLSSKDYDRRDYYTKRRYLDELKPGIKRAIIEHTDWETAGFFGYKPEE